MKTAIFYSEIRGLIDKSKTSKAWERTRILSQILFFFIYVREIAHIRRRPMFELKKLTNGIVKGNPRTLT